MKVLASLAAACAVALCATPGAAQTFTGQFDPGVHWLNLPVGGLWGPDTMRFQLTADLSETSIFPEVMTYNWQVMTVDMGPNRPRGEVYGEDFNWFYPITVTPTGFNQTFHFDSNPTCDPYRPPYYCYHESIEALSIDWNNPTNHAVDYVLKITAVPEPQAWAAMILGFGLLGASLRRRRIGPVLAG